MCRCTDISNKVVGECSILNLIQMMVESHQLANVRDPISDLNEGEVVGVHFV